VAAHEAGGVAVSAKHFPGHGDTASDSHHALPVVDLPLETLRERELVPFRAAVAAGARTVMSSHILLPQLDADA
ncbi:glycoside hydrolase family 3 N-terminal domain-containing protein, partial [Schumannella sp. 10F1B-5-1]